MHGRGGRSRITTSSKYIELFQNEQQLGTGWRLAYMSLLGRARNSNLFRPLLRGVALVASVHSGTSVLTRKHILQIIHDK